MSESLLKAYVVGSEEERGTSQQLSESVWAEAYESGMVVEPPYDLEALSRLYETNATHKACVDAKTANIVGLGYRFVPSGGQLGKASAANRALLERLWENCNPEMTFTEIMRAVWTDVESTGNGYIEITRNSRGEIDGFYHVPATTIRVRADHEGFVQIREGRRRHFRKVGGPAVTDPETGEVQNEMLQFRKYTPLSSYYGVPDIVAALGAAAGDRAAREYNIDFFEHNAVPRMAIVVEGGRLSDNLMRQIKDYMENELKGKGHKTLLMEVPNTETRVRFEKLSMTGIEDAAFLGYRRANRDEILMVHRVPPSKITIVENANLANSRDQDKTFREQVVRPEQRRIEYKFNTLIREQLGIGDWEFRFREMDLGEEREQAEIAKIYREIGAWTVDEIRSKLGLAPRRDGEEDKEG